MDKFISQRMPEQCRKTKEKDFYTENARLKRELEEARKENLFLKKAAAFFASQTDK
jgi:hypothetical protein